MRIKNPIEKQDYSDFGRGGSARYRGDANKALFRFTRNVEEAGGGPFEFHELMGFAPWVSETQMLEMIDRLKADGTLAQTKVGSRILFHIIGSQAAQHPIEGGVGKAAVKPDTWEVEPDEYLGNDGEADYYLLNDNVYKREGSGEDAYTSWQGSYVEWQDSYAAKQITGDTPLYKRASRRPFEKQDWYGWLAEFVQGLVADARESGEDLVIDVDEVEAAYLEQGGHLTQDEKFMLFEEFKREMQNKGIKGMPGGHTTYYYHKGISKESRKFVYIVDMDERGEWRAHVEDESGAIVLELEPWVFEDGFMRRQDDMYGLLEYMIRLGIAEEGDRVVTVTDPEYLRGFGSKRQSSGKVGKSAEIIEEQTVGYLDENRPDLTLVTMDTDVAAIKEYLGIDDPDIGGFLVLVGEGDYDEVWGYPGTVPGLDKPAYRYKIDQQTVYGEGHPLAGKSAGKVGKQSRQLVENVYRRLAWQLDGEAALEVLEAEMNQYPPKEVHRAIDVLVDEGRIEIAGDVVRVLAGVTKQESKKISDDVFHAMTEAGEPVDGNYIASVLPGYTDEQINMALLHLRVLKIIRYKHPSKYEIAKQLGEEEPAFEEFWTEDIKDIILGLLERNEGKYVVYSKIVEAAIEQGIDDDATVMDMLAHLESQELIEGKDLEDEPAWRLVEEKKVGKRVKFKKRVPIMKIDAKHRVVYGVVYSPYEVDTQDDWSDEDEILKAVHYYMMHSQQIGKNHIEMMGGKAAVVECGYAHADWPPFRKGEWFMGTKILDDDEWRQVENGEITGYSMGGDGLRVERGIPAGSAA